MQLWGQVNLLIGAAAVSLTHFIVLLLGSPPMDVFWHGGLFFIVAGVAYFYYGKYKRTKETVNNANDTE